MTNRTGCLIPSGKSAAPQSMIRKSLPSDAIRGWKPVSRLREALAKTCGRLDASAGEGRAEKIMLNQNARAPNRFDLKRLTL
jgi:hypothetical protein